MTQQMTSIEWSSADFVTQLGGDDQFARELVALFLVECPKMMAAVRESVEQGTADGVRRAAHTLKGSMSNFIEGAPVTTAFALEQQGASGQLTDAAATLVKLELEVADFVTALRHFEGT